MDKNEVECDYQERMTSNKLYGVLGLLESLGESLENVRILTITNDEGQPPTAIHNGVTYDIGQNDEWQL